MARKKVVEVAAAEQPKKRGGSDTMREAGLKGVLVGFTAEEHARLKQAAGIEGCAMNVIVHRATMAEAQRIIDAFKKS